MLVTSTPGSKCVQHSLVLHEYYSDIVAIGQQDGGILGTQYLICSRPDLYGVPGIPKKGSLGLPAFTYG